MTDIAPSVDPVPTEHATTDDLLNALSHVHRRRILTGLLAAPSSPDPPIATDTFVGPEVNGTHRVAQHHVHLPKLEDYALITWNRDADTVERGPAFSAVRDTLTELNDGPDGLLVAR